MRPTACALLLLILPPLAGCGVQPATPPEQKNAVSVSAAPAEKPPEGVKEKPKEKAKGPPLPGKPAYEFTNLAHLCRAFSNPAKGDMEYGGQVVQITPYSCRVDKQNDGNANAVCHMHPSAARDLAGIRGKTTIKGFVRGREDDARSVYGYVVVLENCVVVKD